MLQSKLANIKKNKNLREIVNGSTIFMATKLGGIFLTFSFAWYVTNFFGANRWGVFAICFSTLNIFSIICMMGFDKIIIKYVAEFHSKKEYSKLKDLFLRITKIVFPLTCLFSGLLLYFPLEYCQVFLDSATLGPWIQTVAIILPGFVFFKLHTSAVSGLKKIAIFGFFQNIALYGGALILFLLINHVLLPKYLPRFLGSGIFLMISFGIITYLSLFFLNKLTYWNLGLEKIHKHRSFSYTKLLKQAMPMFLIGYLVIVITTADLFMLGYLKTNADVGLYDIAVKVSIIIGTAVIAVNSITSPMISEYYSKKDFKQLKQTVAYASKLNFILTIPLLIFVLFFSEQILQFFGNEFLEAKTALIILAVGQSTIAFSGPARSLLVMTNGQEALQNIMIGSVVLNIILNYLLIPGLSLMGAAIASAITITIMNVGAVFISYQKLNIIPLYIPFRSFE